MTTLYVLSAVPGSGKSTWAKRFKEAHPNTMIVSSDGLRKEFFGKIDDFRDEPFIWRKYLERLNEYQQLNDDITVIADATNLQNRYRIIYAKETPKFDKHVLVLFNVPYDICIARNKHRNPQKRVPDDAMKSLIEEYQPLSDEARACYDEIIEVTPENNLNGI